MAIARTAYWHGVDFTATARLGFGLNLQGGTSTGRGVRDTCNVTRALPELLGTARVDSCDVTENWATSFRGLASYTLPKIDVLVSASIRSLVTPPGGSASNGLSLAANYAVPNTVIQQSLGRLPANALPTGLTTVNLLNPGSSTRSSARISWTCASRRSSASAARRTDVGIDLYNLFNSNVTTAYQQTYRVRDQRRGVAAADGDRLAAAGALPRDVQFLGGQEVRSQESGGSGIRTSGHGPGQRNQSLWLRP